MDFSHLKELIANHRPVLAAVALIVLLATLSGAYLLGSSGELPWNRKRKPNEKWADFIEKLLNDAERNVKLLNKRAKNARRLSSSLFILDIACGIYLGTASAFTRYAGNNQAPSSVQVVVNGLVACLFVASSTIQARRHPDRTAMEYETRAWILDKAVNRATILFNTNRIWFQDGSTNSPAPIEEALTEAVDDANRPLHIRPHIAFTPEGAATQLQPPPTPPPAAPPAAP
jgi:hypothetical protein